MSYNKGYGDLKEAKLKFLKKDLADNAESMKILNKIRNKRIAARSLGLIALVIFPK